MNLELIPTIEDLRPDLLAIADLIPDHSRVLDLGCGDGTLLAYLKHSKQIIGRGIEISEDGVLACVRRGLSVRQGNLQEGLADYPNKSFDVVTLSQTLRYLNDPQMIVGEMLRVGQFAVVSFSNWGYWRARFTLLFGGHIPKAPDHNQPWDEPPRWQAFTIADFTKFCQKNDFQIRNRVFISGHRRGNLFSNFMAKSAVFELEKPEH
jgi:methionine biosynthesis protein MetW